MSNYDKFHQVKIKNIQMKYLLLILVYSIASPVSAQFKLTEPLSPPQLVMPLDSERVEMPRPLFTWLPPTPLTGFSNLMYDWILVDIMGGQTGSDAIQQNIPVFTRQNISFTNFQYPLSAPALDSNKLYAWRVTAKSNMTPVANSEIWTFRLKQIDSANSVPMQRGSYVKMKREHNAALAIVSDIVRYEYLNESNDNTIILTLADITGPSQTKIPLDTVFQKIHFGKNLLQLDISKNKAMINKHIYILEVVNSRRERWYLKFEYREQEKR